MKGYLRRVGFGLLILAGLIVGTAVWLVLPGYWMVVTESWLVRVGCLVWMTFLPVLGLAIPDDDGAPNLVLRRPPRPPNNHKGRMGGE